MTANIKALLTSIRSMVVKMLPAYRFFTGRTTETTTTQICSGDVHGILGAQIAFSEGAITSFVQGDVYNLTVNGETHQITVKKNDEGLQFVTGGLGSDANGNVSFPNNSGFGFFCYESGAECDAQGEYIGASITLTKEDGTVVYSGTPEYNIAALQLARVLNGNVLPTVGDTYDVEINGTVCQNQLSIVEVDGKSYGYLGTGTYDARTSALSPENSWLILFGDTNPLYLGNGTFTNATVSVSQTKTVVVEHYDTKKLPEECLPSSVAKQKDVNAAKAEAKNAAATAQSTADDALSSAENAQMVANSAKTAAATAQSTANDAMTKSNPTCTGSFSQNRKSGTGIGSFSHAEGYDTTANGYCSHAEGYGTTAGGDYSHAEGSGTTAGGDYSHAEGSGTTASATGSHAEGSGTTASATGSHAEGNNTTASGNYSHAEGSFTTASEFYSHAEGYETIASSWHQHVQGKYNVEDSVSKYAHIVGNGSYESGCSNAHTLDWSGVPWFQGRPQFGGTAQDNGSQTVVANGDKEITLLSSTASSTKKLTLTINDSGVISATDSDGTVYTLGAKGDKGDKGDQGDPYTLTDADKQTITNAVLAALPTWTGGDF